MTGPRAFGSRSRGARSGFRTKRAYDPPAQGDGRRILIDRLWPRGVSKEALRLYDWRRELAPSSGLRTWFRHDPAKYPRFRELYRRELLGRPEMLAKLIVEAERGPVTLVYAAKDALHSNATVLHELLCELNEER